MKRTICMLVCALTLGACAGAEGPDDTHPPMPLPARTQAPSSQPAPAPQPAPTPTPQREVTP